MSRGSRLAGTSARQSTVVLAVLLVLAALLAARPAHASATAVTPPATFPTVTLNRVISNAGFVHPGLGVSADSLLNARRQVVAGVEPWASYYAAMMATPYSSTTFTSANAATAVDRPGTDVFASSSVQTKFIDDAFRAYTQALLYVITGDPAYRENGMRLIRIWGHMDPTKYAYYADAQIHTGVPLLQLLSAAELLRYSSVNPGTSGYDLVWRDADTSALTDNLVKPMTATFLFSNTNFMNQHLYALVGALAGAVFTDDQSLYRQRVEWFSVNATDSDTYANGALTSVIRRIDAKDPLNHYGYSFIQDQEMGRDQAHAWDDIAKLSQIAQLLTIQNTRLDPHDGTVSTKKDAVSPYRFAGDRLLAGADAYYAYTMGKTVPWIDTSNHAGVLAEAYRGRLFQPIDQLYDIYRYDLGVDVARRAPNVARAAQQPDGPTFFWGTAAYNFWNSNPDYNPDYWLSLPSAVAKQVRRPVQIDPLVQVEQRSIAMGGGSSVRREGDRSFVRLRGGKQGATIAVRTLMYDSRQGYSPVGVLVRTNGEATLQLRKDQRRPAYLTLNVPDTGGQWRYVVYDMDQGLLPGTVAGQNLAYFTVLGSAGTSVDVDSINLQAKSQLSPPVFPQGRQAPLIAVAGEPLARSLAATDSAGDPLHYTSDRLPPGATLDALTGALDWSPGTGDVGSHRLFLAADDGTVDTVLDVTINVVATRADAVTAALARYQSGQDYLSATLESLTAARAAAEQAAASGDDSTFAASLVALQGAVSGLQPLNPRLPDGTLDYRQIVSSPTLTGYAIANMADGDFNSTSGDLRAPFILDFGTAFKVQADAVGLQARWNFANRSEGANVYGSDDGESWTLLTSRETTNTTEAGFAMETIPARDEVRGQAFRYLKVQIDDPGVPTDPAYPGISSFGELRIDGQRIETAPTGA
jgi:hypothetical protein